MEDNKSELDVQIRNLCILIHTELESIDSPFQNSETVTSILTLDSFKCLDYITKVVDQALEAKKKAREIPSYSDFLNSESYQKEMQKLENEIRNHIKIEQQMKLYADALEEKNQQVENQGKDLKKKLQNCLDPLKTENKTLKQQIATTTKEISDLKKVQEIRVLDQSSKDMSKIKQRDSIKSTEMDKKIARAEFEHNRVSKSLSEMEKEYQQQKKDNEELKKILKEILGKNIEESKEQGLLYKSKYERKCIELDYMKKRMKAIEAANTRNNRSITPAINKVGNSSQKNLRKASSTEKIRVGRIEKIVQKTDRDQVEKKRLPLSFTARDKYIR